VPWFGAPDMSGAPPDSVRCTRRLHAELLAFGKIQRRLHYNSSDCLVYTGQCPVLQGRAALELACFGNSQRLVRYNSPDISGVHRTVRCDNGATDTSTPTATCSALNARQRTQKSGTPILAHRTLYSTCPVRHRTSRRAQKTELQRSEPNGFGDVARAPDMSGAPCDRQPHQTASLVVGAINTPNHPTFIASKFSTFQPLTRARHSILDTLKRSNSLPNSTQSFSD
jgi:hypothetical protein